MSTHHNTSLLPHSQTAIWLATLRLFVGFWWVIEATIGKFWKLGSISSGVNPEWIGSEAGVVIEKIAQTGIDEGTWWWYAGILETLLLPYAGLWSPIITFLQLIIGLLLIFGFFTRLTAIGGLVMLVSILLMGSYRTSPFLLVGHLFILATSAGQYYSLDNRFSGRNGSALPQSGSLLSSLTRNQWGAIAFVASTIALYFIMQVSRLPMPRFQWVSLEYTVFIGMIVAGIYLYIKSAMSIVTIATAFLRIYLGYKLLWWIWTVPQASLTSLPGFVGAEDLAGVFAQGAESHFAPLAAILNGLFVPMAGFWSIAFGIAQIVIGLMLVLGWRSRQANWALVILMLLYTLLGFTRYVPYIMGFGFIVLALGSGTKISFIDSLIGRPTEEVEPMSLSPMAAALYGILAIVAFALATMLGIIPNGYTSAVGSSVFWTLGIDLGILGIAGLLPVLARSSVPQGTLQNASD